MRQEDVTMWARYPVLGAGRRQGVAFRFIISAMVIAALQAVPQAQCPGLSEDPDADRIRLEYRSTSITIELIGGSAAEQIHFGEPERPARTSWIALRGYERISEDAFYELCGQSIVAAESRARISSAQTSQAVGIVLGAAGAVVAGLAIAHYEEKCVGRICDAELEPRFEIAVPALIVAIAGTALAVEGDKSAKRNHVDFGRAREMADEFNDALCRRLTE